MSGSPCPGSSYQSFPSPIPTPSPGDVVSYTLTGLTTGTTYFVQATAVDTGGGESVCSNQASGLAKADPSDTTPPTGSLTVNSGAASTAWTAATLGLTAADSVGVTGYYVSNSATPPAAGATGWVTVSATKSYSNTNVAYTLSSGDGSKTVYAWFKDAAGNVSGTSSDSILLDQTPPSNGTLTATAGNTQVTLSWSGFVDGGSGLASSNTYKLLRSTGSAPAASCTSGTRVYLGTSRSATNTGLINGTTYYYRVCATDTAGNVSAGGSASATPQGTIDTTPPTVRITSPTSNLTYSTSSNTLSLGGTASDNIGVTSVTWVNDRGGSGTASGTTSWTVSRITLQAGTNALTMTAGDAIGNTGTAILSVIYTASDTTPPACSLVINDNAASTKSTAVTLALAATDNMGVTGYYLSNSSTTPAVGATGWVAVTATTSYSNPSLPYTLPSGDSSKTVYAWYKDAAKNVSPAASDSILLDQTAPRNGTLTATAGGGRVTLTWSGFSDWGSGLASSKTYKLVFRTGGLPAASCTNGTRLLRGSVSSFAHTGLRIGTTYYYRVCAFDKAGNVSTGATANAKVTQ